jgi:sigma-E factor negative regulatory protein RseC
MAERGIVTGVNGPYADVAVRRGMSCEGSCEGCGCSCGNLNLFESGQNREFVVKAKNTAGAHEQDVVVLSLSDGAFFKGSFIAYIVPIVLLFAGAGLGPWGATQLGLSLSTDAAAALFGSAFFVLAFVAVGLYTRRARGSEQDVPEIVEVVGRERTFDENGMFRPDAAR